MNGRLCARLTGALVVPAALLLGAAVLSQPTPAAAQGILAPVCGLTQAIASTLAGTCPPPAVAPAPAAPSTVTQPAVPAAVTGPASCAGRAGKTILISLPAQELTACQDGAVVADTPITTGRDALPTPTGTFSVLRRNSPWIMRSPWPRGSRYWYAPSRVEFTLWFTDVGHAIHDAPWRSSYGPGTQAEGGSHGCVNVPRPTMDHLYAWADLGTPVIITG